MAFVWADWNVSVDANRVVLCKITYYDDSASAEAVLYVGSRYYNDTINGNVYENTITANGIPTLFVGSSDVNNPTSIGIGNLVISNIDAKYDGLFADSFYGRDIEILVGPTENAFADFQTVFKGVISKARFEDGKAISFEIRDYMDKLDMPVQRNRLSGGSMPTSAAGSLAPWAFGAAKNVKPILVHDTNWVFQTGDGAVEDPSVAVYIDAVLFSVSSEDTANAQFTVIVEPAGDLTADIKGAKPGGSFVVDLGDVLTEILTRDDDNSVSILESAELETGSMSQLNTDCDMDIAIWFAPGQEISTIDVLDQLMPEGFLYGFNRDREFFAKVLLDPSGETATQTLGTADIVLNGLTVLESIRPAWKVVCKYQKNYAVIAQPGTGFTNAVFDAHSKDFRFTTSKEDSTIKTTHKDAREMTVELMASSGVAAVTEERDRIFNLFSIRRRIYQVQCWAKPLSFAVGDVTTITYPRYSMDSGVDLTFIGSENRLDSGLVTAYFWG